MTKKKPDDTLTTGERLLVHRHLHHWTQVQAAKRIGVSRDCYARLERGERQQNLEGYLRQVPTRLRLLSSALRCLIYRTRVGLTQQEVANHMGVSRATVNAMERGRVDCTDLCCYWEQ